MLFGRTTELSGIRARLAAEERGESTALVVRGEAGIGKSALVDEVVREVLARPGRTVLRIRGIESESAIPFSGLSDLLRPVLHLLPELPGPQSAALRGALAMGPPRPAARAPAGSAPQGPPRRGRPVRHRRGHPEHPRPGRARRPAAVRGGRR